MNKTKKEYIFSLGEIWDRDKMTFIEIPPYSIVTNVVEVFDDDEISYGHNFMYGDFRSHTFYSWALVENTSDNRKEIYKLIELNKKLEEIKKQVSKVGENIKTINNEKFIKAIGGNWDVEIG